MLKIILSILVALFGTSGIAWAIRTARNKRPHLVVWVRGCGIADSKKESDSKDIFFHCQIDNPSTESNSITQIWVVCMNKRGTELIWSAMNGKIYEPDTSTDWIGQQIPLSKLIESKSGVEAIALLTIPTENIGRYLSREFHWKVIFRDSHDNWFTGDLRKGLHLVNFRLLKYLDEWRINMLNADMYARPRLRNIFMFYRGYIWLTITFLIKKALYNIGLISSTGRTNV